MFRAALPGRVVNSGDALKLARTRNSELRVCKCMDTNEESTYYIG